MLNVLAIVGLLVIVCLILFGSRQTSDSGTSKTAFTGADLSHDYEADGATLGKLPKRIFDQVGTRVKNALREDWSKLGLGLLLVIGAMLFVWHWYFPTEFNLWWHNGNWAIWVLLFELVVWSLVKSVVKKYPPIPVFVYIIIGITGLSMLISTAVAHWQYTCDTMGPRCWVKEAEAVANKNRKQQDTAKAKYKTLFADRRMMPDCHKADSLRTIRVRVTREFATYYIRPVNCGVHWDFAPEDQDKEYQTLVVRDSVTHDTVTHIPGSEGNNHVRLFLGFQLRLTRDDSAWMIIRTYPI